MREKQVESIYRNYEGVDFAAPATNRPTATGLPKAERTLTPLERYLKREINRVDGRRLSEIPDSGTLTRAQIGQRIVR